jgi:hypothetical protein
VLASLHRCPDGIDQDVRRHVLRRRAIWRREDDGETLASVLAPRAPARARPAGVSHGSHRAPQLHGTDSGLSPCGIGDGGPSTTSILPMYGHHEGVTVMAPTSVVLVNSSAKQRSPVARSRNGHELQPLMTTATMSR